MIEPEFAFMYDKVNSYIVFLKGKVRFRLKPFVSYIYIKAVVLFCV